MNSAVARLGDAMVEETLVDHIDVSEYDYDPNGPDWEYGEIDATVSGQIKTSSNNVFINNLGAARKGDNTNENDDYNLGSWDYYEGGQHLNATGEITGGSSTVFVNGVPLARVGDSINTHANTSTTIAAGSPNVFSG